MTLRPRSAERGRGRVSPRCSPRARTTCTTWTQSRARPPRRASREGRIIKVPCFPPVHSREGPSRGQKIPSRKACRMVPPCGESAVRRPTRASRWGVIPTSSGPKRRASGVGRPRRTMYRTAPVRAQFLESIAQLLRGVWRSVQITTTRLRRNQSFRLVRMSMVSGPGRMKPPSPFREDRMPSIRR